MEAVNRSPKYVKDILLSSKEMAQFVETNWHGRYMEQIKAQYKSVYRSLMNSDGTQKSKDMTTSIGSSSNWSTRSSNYKSSTTACQDSR